jgi:hypothetical protein
MWIVRAGERSFRQRKGAGTLAARTTREQADDCSGFAGRRVARRGR